MSQGKSDPQASMSFCIASSESPFPADRSLPPSSTAASKAPNASSTTAGNSRGSSCGARNPWSTRFRKLSPAGKNKTFRASGKPGGSLDANASESSKSRKSLGQGSPLESICFQYPCKADSRRTHSTEKVTITTVESCERMPLSKCSSNTVFPCRAKLDCSSLGDVCAASGLSSQAKPTPLIRAIAWVNGQRCRCSASATTHSSGKQRPAADLQGCSLVNVKIDSQLGHVACSPQT
mmetsp:Transcript_14673/g.26926  ORF Transcript_14673/g.26926 Transcript_14673/m.26926 type:complete len:236 (+) Transcript_14673:364-1071(+)